MKKLFAAVSSGLLLAFSWPSIGVFPLIFFAFLPLLMLEESSEKRKSVFGYGYLAFFIFNLITTYWVWQATAVGSVVAFLLNSLLMAFAFYVFHKIKKSIKPRLGYLGFIVCWLSFEYLHLHWDLSWPWLTLGNVFANVPSIVQWYEYTGVLGGSLWVLLVNILIFKAWTTESDKQKWISPFLVLVVPVLISFYLGAIKDLIMEKSTHEIVIAQPNVDPYIDKFNVGYDQQLVDFIVLAKTKLTQNTTLLIGPETALQEEIWENKLEATYSVRAFKELQKQFPNLNILVGASTYKMFSHGEQKTTTTRQIRNEHVYYDAYNSAVFIPDSGEVQVYHKTKLVPGAEKTPFPKLLDKLVGIMLDLGGTSGSLGTKNKVHQFEVNEMSIQPLICYESIYGDLQKGNTNLIAIITNDGWWKNTAGYKQHFEYARLRAVEQRRMIVRSANTGISGVISPYGEVIESTNWDEAICITANISLNNETTFYSKFGDYIGRLSVFMAFMLMITSFVKGRLKK
ncbi:MAG: apolipoprotein N-acyltransferase [Flavobacteriales bacterium]|jgi:apolipoprotein N-acyltransferase|nr:apolipoprotein N-acyltransferase [Flavobacteriales bacterium]MBT5090129.1 apolipoprotein N-acyltransferase [Flavobacteriales bacterium]MBT5750133.1 apolipoprotein N-acyltransferase [Flavobacteriales bacterium]